MIVARGLLCSCANALSFTLRSMDNALNQALQITDPMERAIALQTVIDDAGALAARASRYRRDAIADARAQGLNAVEIAGHLGVTPGRVRQIPPSSSPQPSKALATIPDRST